MVKIIDDIIPVHAQTEAEELLLSMQFSWFHYANTNYDDNQTRDDDTPQFCHGFMRDNKNNSAFSAIPLTILKQLDITPDQVIRAKANLMICEPKNILNPKHTDDNQDHIVFVYYVNDSDGDTHIWQNDGSVKTVKPKRGRGVFFDGRLLHASSTPTKHRYRIVINFNLKPGCIDL